MVRQAGRFPLRDIPRVASCCVQPHRMKMQVMNPDVCARAEKAQKFGVRQQRVGIMA